MGPSFSPSHILLKQTNHPKITDIPLPASANFYQFPVIPQPIEINTIPINVFKTNIPKPTLAKSKEVTSSLNYTSRRQAPAINIPFKCLLCTQVFKTQGHLNEHLRKDHSVLI